MSIYGQQTDPFGTSPSTELADGLELFDLDVLGRGRSATGIASEELELEEELSGPALDAAVQANRRSGQSLGWGQYYDRIARDALGYSDTTPNERVFTQSVADWQRARGLTADGVIGPATWSAMRQALRVTPAAPGPVGTDPTVNTPLPAKGPGFYSYVAEHRRYGVPDTIRALTSIAAAWQRAYPSAPAIGIGDISFKGGGLMPNHVSHQKGVDIDIRPVRGDGQAKAVTIQDSAYSRPLTQALVNLIRANGILPVRYVFFNDSAVTGVKWQKGHENHLHVRFSLPTSAPGSGGPLAAPPASTRGPAPAAPTRPIGPAPPVTPSVTSPIAAPAGLTASEEKALRITSTFETGRALNFGGFVGNFDGQGLSYGLLQWNIGTGSLQPMLRDFATRAPQEFNTVFGPHAEGFRRLLAAGAGKKEPTSEQRQWVSSINASDQKTIVEPWKTYLQRLGNAPTFQQIQIAGVRERMKHAVNYARQFGLRSERALAFLFDTVTQNGNWWIKKKNRQALIDQRRAAVERQRGRGLTERELLTVIADVLAATVLPRWSPAVRARRMAIVNGRGVVHRSNLDLDGQYGLSDNPFTTSVA